MFTKSKPYLHITLLVFIMSAAFTSAAQTTTVSGKVTDAVSGEALSAVSVKFINTNKGIVTDSNGNYTLSTTAKVTQIQFAYLGYQTVSKKITPGVQQVLNIKLITDSHTLPETVVKASRRVHYKNKDNPAVAL